MKQCNQTYKKNTHCANHPFLCDIYNMCTAHTVHTAHTVYTVNTAHTAAVSATILKCARTERCRLLTFVQCSHIVPSPTHVAAQNRPLWLISTSSIYHSYSNCNSMTNKSQICKSATLQLLTSVLCSHLFQLLLQRPIWFLLHQRPMSNQLHAAPSHEVLMYFHNLSYTTLC